MASSSADIFADPYDAQDVRDGEEGDEVASVTEEEVLEEEEDSMDDFDLGKLSPRKKRRSRGGSAARSRGKATTRPYKACREAPRDMGWERGLLAEGLSQSEFDSFLEADGIAKAPGLGYQNAGVWRVRRDGTKRLVQRCGYFHESPSCPAQREIICDCDGLYKVSESTADDFMHVDHTGSMRAKGLPGEVRAMFSPGDEDRPPKQLRAKLRKKGLVFDAQGKMAKLVAGYSVILRQKKRATEMPEGARGRCAPLTRTALPARRSPLAVAAHRRRSPSLLAFAFTTFAARLCFHRSHCC